MYKVADINTRLADEKEQRLRRIRLIERETLEFAPMWAAKQATLYPTAVPISQTPTLGQVITEEVQKNAMNSDVLYQRAEQKLLQLADKTNADYILDRLEDQDLYYLVNNWDGLVKELKEKYASSGLDKNIFISLVKKNASDMDMNLSGFSNDLTQRGQLRQKQKEDELKAKQAELDAIQAKDAIAKSKLRKHAMRKVRDRHKYTEEEHNEQDLMGAEDDSKALSRNAKKHQKYKARNQEIRNEVKNTMNDMLGLLAPGEQSEEKQPIGTDEMDDQIRDDEKDTKKDDEKDENKSDPLPPDLIDYTKKASILKTKTFKDKYNQGREDIDYRYSKNIFPDINDLYDGIKDDPEFKKIKEKFPNKSKRELLKTVVRAFLLKHLVEEENRYPEGYLNIDDELVDLTKKAGRQQRKFVKVRRKSIASEREINVPLTPKSYTPKSQRKTLRKPEEAEEAMEGMGLKNKKRRIVGKSMEGVNEAKKAKKP